MATQQTQYEEQKNMQAQNQTAGQGQTAQTTTQPPPDIGQMYGDSLKAQQNAIDQGVKTSQMAYQKQIDDASKTYDPMRKEAYANDRIAQRSLRERMANMGMGAGGGKSMTLQNNQQSALLNRLGDISRQQQQTVDNANFEMNRLKSQGEADKASAMAQNTSEMNQSKLNDYYKNKEYDFQDQQFKYQKDRDVVIDAQWNKNFGLQQDQFGYQKERDKANDDYRDRRDVINDKRYADETQYKKDRDTVTDGQWKSQLDYTKTRDTNSEMLNLLQSRLITKNQYDSKTGYQLFKNKAKKKTK